MAACFEVLEVVCMTEVAACFEVLEVVCMTEVAACFEVLEVVCMTEAACLEEALQTEVDLTGHSVHQTASQTVAAHSSFSAVLLFLYFAACAGNISYAEMLDHLASVS